jgi:hypothetical protein
MRDYIKILSSIIASLATLAVLASAIRGGYALISGSSNIAQAFLFPFVFVWFGFVLFGIIGSALWFGILKLTGTLAIGQMTRHVVAASLSAGASWLVLGLLASGGNSQALLETAPLLIIVVPVVALSLLWYWFLYLQPKLNKANH